MSTEAGKKDKANTSAGEDETEGGLLPAILAGAGILAVVGLLVFWPDGKEDAKKDQKATATAAKTDGANAGSAASAAAQGAGGVGARSVDAATPGASASKGKVNQKLLPKGLGMAPGVPVEEPPPKFKTVDDEIAWYEAKLVKANDAVESRKKFVERLPKMKQRAEESADPAAELQKYESSKRIVEGNLTKAESKVEEIEKKLADLRGE